MIENVKYKVADVAKDLKQPVKDVLDVLGEKSPGYSYRRRTELCF